MPLVSDPGYNLVEEVIKNGHEIEVIPGPSATISTLILSGLESDRFTFVGFLPRRKSRAMNILNKFIESETTVIIYESPFRIKELIRNIKETYGNEVRMAACNDITKKFEKTLRGNPDEILNQLGEAIPKGEWSLALRF